jgi:hypothetical protein
LAILIKFFIKKSYLGLSAEVYIVEFTFLHCYSLRKLN